MNNYASLEKNKANNDDKEVDASGRHARDYRENRTSGLPFGFQESDVHSQAPRLFSDHFMVFYSEIMTSHGLTAFSLALTT